ncbi:hypothetical protein [Nostoc sp. JL23]|uniref:hypothetical protein n=1 Tax=Nostoc sp. JL23 TaxID=2815394 RepID=UPI001D400E54|nr:hypothetical protein [Nostoc sp. JL23]MBN3875225.1 hypothetical protein [Nostoc sp. JL23]
MTRQTIKISSLQQRYKLNSRQAVNNRINGLNIEPIKRGEISAEQLDLLDRLDKHIRSGGAIADFPIQPEVQVEALDKLDKLEQDIEFNNSDAMPAAGYANAINIMAELMEKMMSYAYARDSSPLTNYEELEKAAEFEWILPTSKIKELIGVSPKAAKDGDTFIRGSFAFIKLGKVGNETGWQVLKQVPIAQR